MNATIAEVRMYAEQLDDGGTYRGCCPECGRKDTFTVTKKGTGYVYNCYSAHCGLKGASGVQVVGDLLRNNLAPPKASKGPFRGQLGILSIEQRKFLKDKVGFTDWHINVSGVRYAPVEDRYAYPIFDPKGLFRGWVLRAYDGEGIRAKTLTIMNKEEPHMSWYAEYPRDESKKVVVVVEDIPSAVRAVQHVPMCVAMCGGGIGPDYVRELREHADSVVWAFDADAFSEGMRHHMRYGLTFENSRVLRLERDLKDMAEDDLKTLLSEV